MAAIRLGKKEESLAREIFARPTIQLPKFTEEQKKVIRIASELTHTNKFRREEAAKALEDFRYTERAAYRIARDGLEKAEKREADPEVKKLMRTALSKLNAYPTSSLL